MDNFIAELFLKHKILLKSTKTLDFKKFSKKRNYELIYGVDNENFHTLVFLRSAKSKMLKAEIEALDILADKIALELGIIVKKRILFYNSTICSKVLNFNKIWKFYDFM